MSASAIALRIGEFAAFGLFAFLIPPPPGLNSVVNITDTVNNNITNLVINSIQIASTNLFQNQTLNIDCREWQKLTSQGLVGCASEFNGKMTPEKAAELCNTIWGAKCGANQVSMKGVMEVKISDDMKITVKKNISDNIKTTINNAASQTNSGIIGLGNTVTTKVGSDIDNISNILENYIQTDYNNIASSQTINVKDGYVSLITQDMFINSFKSYTANNNSYISSINNISSAIQNIAEQNLGLLGGNIIITIVVVIIGILIIIGVILWILKTNSKKKHHTK